MSFLKLMLVLAVALVSVSVVSSNASAEDGKTCHADTDCGHGEHCKDGHCHK
ncbi:MAG: hypothetical protein IT290_03980 [Deltaproteobacteria bacterium]|nr:hypothetical protein [Deltaproteobacteria bacterium]